MRRREHPVRNLENSPGPSSHTDTEAGKHYKIEKIDILKAFIPPWVTWLLNPSLVVTESLKEDLHDSKSRAFHIKFGLLTTSHFNTGGGNRDLQKIILHQFGVILNPIIFWINFSNEWKLCQLFNECNWRKAKRIKSFRRTVSIIRNQLFFLIYFTDISTKHWFNFQMKRIFYWGEVSKTKTFKWSITARNIRKKSF